MLSNDSPYCQIAPFYDHIMKHVNYKMWARYIKTLISHYGNNVKNIIDLSCGTGTILTFFDLKKWKVCGCDLSFAMVREAKKKQKLARLPLCCSDFRHIPARAKNFDVVLILYDSINYLIKDEQICPFFDEVATILKKGGLFIFDIVTPQSCKENFSDYNENKYWADNGYTRHGWYSDEDNIQYNKFEILINGKKYTEIHEQKIRPVSEWEKFISKSKFKIIRSLNNFTLLDANKMSERVHFVCKKESEY